MDIAEERERLITTLTVTPYLRRHRQAVQTLLSRNYQVHTHLDWNDTNYWLESSDVPMRLAWQGEQLVGLIGVSTPLHHSCWLRLIAVREDSPANDVLSALWGGLEDELYALDVKIVALLTTRNWIERYTSQLGMRYIEDIVTMARIGGELPTPQPSRATIRAAQDDDLGIITEIDQAAFKAPWQLSATEIRQAHRMAAVSTVAVQNGEIIGYQISTAHRNSSHLARLAVRPDIQQNGIGALLLRDVIERFVRRNIRSMTVNTQGSNERSQRLYRRFGFYANGYDMPVWMREL